MNNQAFKRFLTLAARSFIRLVTSDGKVFFTDCLSIPSVCTGSSGFRHLVKVSAFFGSGAPIFWPVSVVNTDGRTVVTVEASRQTYALFTYREGSLYRFPLALAATFVVFAIWFGKRPAFG